MLKIIVMTKVLKILAKKVNPSGKSEVLLRLRHGRNITLRAKTHLFISPKFFVKNREGTSDVPGEIVVKSKFNTPEIIQAKEVRNKIEEMCRLFEDLICSENPANITLNWLQEHVDKYVYGDDSPQESVSHQTKNIIQPF